MNDIMEALPDYVVGFDPCEVDEVITDYVCPVCHGQLTAFNVPSDRIYIIICVEHGNVETIGRIRRESVNIDMERAFRQFDNVVNNLPEFWGELKRHRQSAEKNLHDLGF